MFVSEESLAKKSKVDAIAKPMSVKDLYARGKKLAARSPEHLQFELWLTRYFGVHGLPWGIMDSEEHKMFWARFGSKYLMKHSTTYTRAKLPLLFSNVKQAVEKQIGEHLPHTTGVAFTCDHWSSRNQDPYIGLTMHFISKEWKMLR